MPLRSLFNPLLKPSNARIVLVRNLLILAILTAGMIFAATFLIGSEVGTKISQSQIEQTTNQARLKFSQFFTPIIDTLTIAQKWGESGLIDLADDTDLNKKFFPIIEQFTNISAVIIAQSDGSEYFMTRADGELRTRMTQMQDSNTRFLWKRWNKVEHPIAEWSEKTEYDPRERPWYQGAMSLFKQEDIYWTQPYTFFTAKSPGITIAARWHSGDKKEADFVIAFDVLLNDIFHLLSRLKVTDNGNTFLFNEAGDVLKLPKNGQAPHMGAAEQSFFRPVDTLATPVVARAIQGWLSGERDSLDAVRFTSEGKSWWAGFQPLDPQSKKLWIGVAIPENDLIGKIRRFRHLYFVIVAVLLTTGIAITALLIHRHSRRLKESIANGVLGNDDEKHLLSLVKCGESAKLEFKSTMRKNLKTNKFGKEIELAWLKTVAAFMNTDGGTLLIGIGDSGEIFGIDADDFENDDRCRLHFKNLINQHIGLEFSKLLSFQIRAIAGKKIIALECASSREPVFLRTKNEEAFYIRSGPSSVSLPISKTLRYLDGRQ